MTRQLSLYEDFSRREVHDIFDPEAPFTTGSGLWGMQGIIQIPGRPKDFVLFVSYGRSAGAHQFDEGVSPDGILRWQSQPAQSLFDAQIGQFIAHDESANSIYLFLRTRMRVGRNLLPYTFLGKLKYRGHDATREKPVWFTWQLLSWPIPGEVRAHMGLQLDGIAVEKAKLGNGGSVGSLILEAAPRQRKSNPETTPKFRAVQRRYPSDAENKALGLDGEKLVLKHEKENLIKLGRPDLADLVKHTSVEEGDGAGFDIRSFFADGRFKYIEVKTTVGPKTSDFFMSPTEIAFSQTHSAQYELRRLFDYDRDNDSAKCFSLFGDISSQLALVATQYRVSRLTDE